MEGGFILCFAAMMLFMAPGVKATAHLSFATNISQVNITRAGCGNTKVCVETPMKCDPAGNATCLFGSAVASAPVAPNGANVTVQLRGNSTGYIALGLTANETKGTTMLFICGQNSSDNGNFFFRTMQLNNTNQMLMATETQVKEIRGVVSGSLIQCEFIVLNVNASSTRNTQDTSFKILLGSGSVTGDVIGPFSITLTSDLLDLANPSGTSTVAPTTAGAGSLLHSYALLLLLGVVALSFTHRA
ncbi:putative ferric-chelate reductase 1 [Platichthys flesus]|uniref:putative ferric-chelate reductase 1 n=1 Tax=Platichthys flesus TaxID=8260 RepID=UPI002DBD92B2|nr:putative ferric-chelate reductase 1 [Platichthys flesus]